jgi:hypothetical protein
MIKNLHDLKKHLITYTISFKTMQHFLLILVIFVIGLSIESTVTIPPFKLIYAQILFTDYNNVDIGNRNTTTTLNSTTIDSLQSNANAGSAPDIGYNYEDNFY